jgi:hypothetical protein
MQIEITEKTVSLRGALLSDHSTTLRGALRRVLRRQPDVVVDGSGICAWDPEGLHTMIALDTVAEHKVEVTGFPPRMLEDMRAMPRPALTL